MHDDIIEAVEDMIEESGKPRKAIAEEIGKPYKTLMRELNSMDGGAKIGARDLVPLMRVCGGLQPLEHLAARMGCRVVCLDAIQPDKEDIRDELLDDDPLLVAFRQCIRSEEHPEKVLRCLRELIRELEEDYALYRSQWEQRRTVHSIRKAG